MEKLHYTISNLYGVDVFGKSCNITTVKIQAVVFQRITEIRTGQEKCIRISSLKDCANIQHLEEDLQAKELFYFIDRCEQNRKNPDLPPVLAVDVFK